MLPLKIAILWHFHQPYYKKDGEFILPWVRLHGVKDYRDLPELAHEFPKLKQTINVVPSLIKQFDEYISENTIDIIQRLTLIKSLELTDSDKKEILKYFFLCNIENMVLPYPRYSELYGKFGNTIDSYSNFTNQDWLDLQVWYNLTWVGYTSRKESAINRLFAKERNFTEEEKLMLLTLHLQILSEVKSQFKLLNSLGQVEFSCSPMYHPILPLLCNSETAKEALPNLELPDLIFKHPEDAEAQITNGLNFFKDTFGFKCNGMWPSEGSVSNVVLDIIAASGIKWIATDEEVLYWSQNGLLKETDKYFPHKFITKNGKLAILFRDHNLSDTIGFVYSKWNHFDAVNDFMHRLRHIKSQIINECGEEALKFAVVPIILDGENCWEYYKENGMDFRRELFHQLSDSTDFKTITMSEALDDNSLEFLPPKNNIRAGSWINANFNIWIGHQEHRLAWTMLAKAREEIEKQRNNIPEDKFYKAMEELYIAEGSDWFWWYGDTHQAENKKDFDVLFRWHIEKVYKILGIDVPEDVIIPIGKQTKNHKNQTGIVNPIIDGKNTNSDEWSNAGYFDTIASTGTMHQVGEIINKIWFASDNNNIFIRIDKTKTLSNNDSIILEFDEPNKFSITIALNKIDLSSYEPITLKDFAFSNDDIIEMRISKFWTQNEHSKLSLIIKTISEKGTIIYPSQGKVTFLVE